MDRRETPGRLAQQWGAVKGHSGIGGNEAADRISRKAKWVEAWLAQPEIATPAGVRHAFALFTKLAHLKWDREALRGLVYPTDGRPRPLKHAHWLWTIERAEDSNHLPVFRATREWPGSRVAWFAGGPGPAGSSYLLTTFFFFKSQIPT